MTIQNQSLVKNSRAKVSTVKVEKPERIRPEQVAKDETYLGGYAYQIVAQQAKQISELRSQVLADLDPEPLHQMRISTRKLRAALSLFSDTFTIDAKPKKGDIGDFSGDSAGSALGNLKTAKAVKKLTQALGHVRDLDVMQQWFEQALTTYSQASSKTNGKTNSQAGKNSAEPTEKPKENCIEKSTEKTEKKVKKSDQRCFSKQERKTLKVLLKKLKKQRKKAFSQLKEDLKGSAYKKLVSQLKQWIKQPAFTMTAQIPASQGAAQKIVTPIAALLEHPGWLVAARTPDSGRAVPLEKITLNQLNRQLAQHGEQLHDLRKQIKQVRYQAEFFRGLYGITYAAQVREFRDLQKILGEFQDQAVISQFLQEALGDDWTDQLPTLHSVFQDSRLKLWRQWQPYQRKYLKLRSSQPNARPNAQTQEQEQAIA